jgi:hypothetical protein
VFTQQLLGVLDLAKAQARARQAAPTAAGPAESNGQPHEERPGSRSAPDLRLGTERPSGPGGSLDDPGKF